VLLLLLYYYIIQSTITIRVSCKSGRAQRQPPTELCMNDNDLIIIILYYTLYIQCHRRKVEPPLASTYLSDQCCSGANSLDDTFRFGYEHKFRFINNNYIVYIIYTLINFIININLKTLKN